jgi:hypothetical protein
MSDTAWILYPDLHKGFRGAVSSQLNGDYFDRCRRMALRSHQIDPRHTRREVLEAHWR